MKKVISTIALLATVATASAQMVDYTNNIQINLGGGAHTLIYTPEQGAHNLGLGALLEAQYQFMFNHHLGLGLGVQVSNLNGNATYNYGSYYNNIMLPGAIYAADVKQHLYNWHERQSVIDLSIPMQFIFRAPINVKYAFQMGLGATLDFPLSAHYKVQDCVYTREAYMNRTNVTYTEMSNHLLGSSRANETGDLDIKSMSVGLLADLGMVINLSKHAGLYLGVYGNYTPTNVNMAASITPELYTYNQTAGQFDYNGTFASDRVAEAMPLEAGIKIGLRLGIGKEVDWKIRHAEEMAAAEKAKADSIAAAEAAEAARLAAEQQAREVAMAKAKAEAEAKAKAEAERIAAEHAAELAKAQAEADKAKAEAERIAKEKAEAEAKAKAEADRLSKEKAEAEARAKAEAEARAKAEAEAREKARAEQKAREEAAFVAGFSDTAYFETAKDMPIFGQLNEDSWNNLKAIMDSHPEINVLITGHTDNVGSASSNKALSQRRADNIKNMLVSKGIDANRIKTVGKGETSPIATNNTPEGRAKNRCIIITIGK